MNTVLTTELDGVCMQVAAPVAALGLRFSVCPWQQRAESASRMAFALIKENTP